MSAVARQKVVLSLTGSGHLLVYQLGACRILLQHPEVVRIAHVVGASGGAIAAAVVAARLPLDVYAKAFIEQRGRGLQLLQDFWAASRRSEDPTATSIARIGLHIATTRCEDGASRVFSFPDLQDSQRIFDCIRASCLIPPTFHPLDIVSSPSPYPDHDGIPLDDPVVGTQFYVDGGIATPAPVVPLSSLHHGANEDVLPTRIIVSPVAGISRHALRISPRPQSLTGWWPQIQVRHDMGCHLSWFNLKALQAAAGNVSSSDLQHWYQRGQDDAQRFLEETTRQFNE